MSFQPSSPRPSGRRRLLVPIGGLVVVVLIAAAAGIWWFLRDDAPDAVSLDTATRSLSTASTAAQDGATTVAGSTEPTTAAAGTAPTSDSTGGTAAPPSAIEGTWSVDTSIGEFDFESSTGTFVGFRVQEELSGIGSTTAVGRTPAVSGSLTVAGTTVSAVNIEADMTALVTNESRRDSRARGALETDRFPTASFVLTQPIDLGDAAAGGEAVSVNATGELTIHGVTKPVQFPLEAQLTNGLIVVVGSLDVTFADYGVSVPTAPIVVSAEDHGPIELQLLFARA
ncbi:MAG: YceI family protein [Acidimicrobiales bacterium]|nr:YceI family protein [Acidimicrobiales bacterium]